VLPIIFHLELTDDDGDECNTIDTDTTFVVWVNPTPVIEVTANDTLICDDQFCDFIRGESKYDYSGTMVVRPCGYS